MEEVPRWKYRRGSTYMEACTSVEYQPVYVGTQVLAYGDQSLEPACYNRALTRKDGVHITAWLTLNRRDTRWHVTVPTAHQCPSRACPWTGQRLTARTLNEPGTLHGPCELPPATAKNHDIVQRPAIFTVLKVSPFLGCGHPSGASVRSSCPAHTSMAAAPF
jgi:hypothetical protein